MYDSEHWAFNKSEETTNVNGRNVNVQVDVCGANGLDKIRNDSIKRNMEVVGTAGKISWDGMGRFPYDVLPYGPTRWQVHCQWKKKKKYGQIERRNIYDS